MEDFANSWRAKVYDAGSTLENGIGWGMVPTDIEDDGDTSTATISNEGTNTIITVGDDYEFDDDDDEEDMDEDDLDDYLQMMAESRAAVEAKDAPPPLFVDITGLASGIVSLAPNKPEEEKQEQSEEVISPFDVEQQSVTSLISEDEELDLTPDNVDKVLDEVRPYLISDGGNVSVQNVDVDTGNVYLFTRGCMRMIMCIVDCYHANGYRTS